MKLSKSCSSCSSIMVLGEPLNSLDDGDIKVLASAEKKSEVSLVGLFGVIGVKSGCDGIGVGLGSEKNNSSEVSNAGFSK